MVPVSRFPEGREPVTADETDQVAHRTGLLQALLVLPLRQRATVVLPGRLRHGRRRLAAWDASLVATTKSLGGQQVEMDYFLYADNGDIYSAESESGLAAAIAPPCQHRRRHAGPGGGGG